MNVDVYIQSGINIQVTQNVSQQADVCSEPNAEVIVEPQARPLYVVGNLPVLVGSGQGGATEEWVDSLYYPRSNPSGYATGIDGSLFVRKTESGVFVTTGQTGQFLTTSQTGYVSTGQLVKFSTVLTSGIESQYVPYPLSLSHRPVSLACEMENNSDNFIYSFVLTGVNTNGFYVSFSDTLSASGYLLYTTITL